MRVRPTLWLGLCTTVWMKQTDKMLLIKIAYDSEFEQVIYDHKNVN